MKAGRTKSDAQARRPIGPGTWWVRDHCPGRTTMITFQCECGKSHSISDEHAGKRGRCSGCGNVMRIPGQRPAVARTAPAAKKPAPAMSPSPRGAASPDFEDPDASRLYDLDDEVAPRPAPVPRGRPCPNCSKPLPSADATFCVDCGYNLKTGKKSSLVVEKPSKPKKRKPSNGSGFFEKRLTSSKFLGGLASLVGGSVWLVLGLMANRIFFYPIILIVGGIFGVLTGLISGDD